MPESAPNAELLSALGQMVRGLSALFWGIPAALIVCVQTAKGDWLRTMGIFPPLLVTAILYYGLHMLGKFQKQERVWRAALERAKVLAIINVGLSPFLYWYNKIPSQLFFTVVISILAFTGMTFLLALNPVLWRLAAMLPDETLRQETKFFTAFNRNLLLVCMALTALFLGIAWSNSLMLEQVFDFIVGLIPPGRRPGPLLILLDRSAGVWLMLFLILPPIAMTMALIWKVKEVIFASVFGSDHG
jgi:hypothetical protein